MGTPEYTVIYRRFRRSKGGRVLDAHDYGYEAWRMVIRRQKRTPKARSKAR